MALTCTIWLRLQFRGLDSARFFSAHLLCFHAQGEIFETGIGIWDPGSTLWPGDFCGSKMGPEKIFYDGIILSWQFRGIPKTQMNFMVYRIHLGRLLFANSPLFNYFQGISNFQENWGTPWKHTPVYPLLPLVDPLFPINSR